MDFYVILGVERGASGTEVERAYTRLARRYHPDINPGDSEAAAFFRRVTEAYQTLRSPERRRAYDEQGEPRTAVRRASVEFRGFDFSTPVSGRRRRSASCSPSCSRTRPAAARPRPAVTCTAR